MNANRSFSVGRPTINRRVLQDGLVMLDAKLYYQDSQYKVEQLENRIKRLVYEDERAKKLTRVANEKAEKLMKARQRHESEIEYSQQIKEWRL